MSSGVAPLPLYSEPFQKFSDPPLPNEDKVVCVDSVRGYVYLVVRVSLWP